MLKEVSNVPSVLSLAILLALEPLYLKKFPPTMIFPSVCMAILETPPSNQLHILNDVSIVLSVLILTILLTAVPLYEVNAPPIIVLPSHWITIVVILLSNQ
jgi:hypothetical protein